MTAGLTFVDAAARGYKFVWHERETLARLAAIPVGVKIVSFTLIIALGLEENMLRQGLILVPAYFLEGWLVCEVIRWAILGERWPPAEISLERRRCITAGTLVYLLLKLVTSMITGLAMASASQDAPGSTLSPDTPTFFILIVLLGMAIWMFRFLWLYIPVALGYPMLVFLKRIESYGTSFYMLGLWLLCVLPTSVVLIGFSDFFLMLFPSGTPDAPSVFYGYAMAFTQAVMESIVAVIASAGMAYGLYPVLSGQSKNVRFL